MINFTLRTVLVFLLFFFYYQTAVVQANPKLITQLQLFDNDSTFRYLYLYNMEGEKVLETCAYLQNDHTWINKSQTEWLIYNGFERKQIERIWVGGKWVNRYSIAFEEVDAVRYERHYKGVEAELNLIKVIESKYEFGKISVQKRYSKFNAGLMLTDSIFYKYESDQLQSSETKTYSPDRSFKIHKDSFIYYPDAKLYQHIFLEKNDSDSWQNRFQTTWYYHSLNGQISSQRVKKWDELAKVWEKAQMYSNKYDAKGLLVEEKSYVWGMMIWEESARYSYDYYEDGSLRKKSFYIPIYNQWRNFLNINYAEIAFNEQMEISSVYGFWGGTKDEAVSTDIPFSFNANMSIKKAQKLKLIYTDITVVSEIKMQDTEKISVYPNPSSGVFYFDQQNYKLDSWTVFSLNGSKVLQNENNFNSGVVDLTTLPNGVYFLKAISGNNIRMQKLIKN